MLQRLYLILPFVLAFMLFGCWGSSSGSTPPSSSSGAGGVSSKGPFVLGSTVTAYKLNTDGSRSTTVASVSTKTTNNLGTYSLSSLSWSGATELEITGRYLNENDGSTNQTATLSAVVDIVDGEAISSNINVLTNLAAKRTLELMKSGSSLKAARSAAQETVVDLFNLNLAAGVELDDLDLTVGSGTNAKANADLLRISAALAATPSILTTLESAIEDGNVTSDSNGSSAFANLARAVNDVNLTEVSNTLESELGVSDAPEAGDTDQNASFASNMYVPVIQTIQNQTKSEDSPQFDITLVADDNDTDPSYNTVTFTATSSDESKATVSLSGSTLTITPVANANGDVDIGVRASDGTFVDTKTFTLSLTAQNDAPSLATIPNQTKDEDSPPFTIALSASDIDGDTITNFSAQSANTSMATVSLSGSTLTITPVANANGNVDINVTVTDPSGLSDTKTFRLTLSEVIDGPILVNSTGTVSEDAADSTLVGSVTISSSGDGAITGMTLNGTGAGNFDINATGHVSLKSGHSIDYESVREYNLTVVATNGVSSNEVSMDITVTDVADEAPVLNSTTIDIDENTTGLIGNILANSGDRSITSMTITSGNDGNFSVSTDGNISVVGSLDHEITISYTLEVNATSDSGSGLATVTVNIANVVDTPPVLGNFTGDIDENATITDIVGSITIQNGGDGTITGFVLSELNFVGDSNAKIAVAGSLDYETKSNYNFTMYATSTAGNSNTVDVNITVNDINEPPIANNASYTTSQDTNLTIDLTLISQDPDSEGSNNANLALASLGNPSQGGSVQYSGGEANITYSPADGFSGVETFTYTIRDGGTTPLGATGTITVNVVAASVPSSGQAVDPYIVGAQFWADVNSDGIQDQNETSTLSDINGSFSFQISVPDDTNVTMIKQGLHNGKPFDGNISAKFKASRGGIISPITSLEGIGFSDNEIITLLTNNGMSAAEFNSTISANELYMDPFSTQLLPLDGDMSGYSDEDINKFRRVLIANVAINSALTMQNGYGMDKADMNSSFFAGAGTPPLGMMISAGINSLGLDSLKSGHARIHARIFVTVSGYVRDRVSQHWGNRDNMQTELQTQMQNSIQPMVNTLSSAYQRAYSYGLSDPKFGWVDRDGHKPMLFIQPHELGSGDVTIVYDSSGSDLNITFKSSSRVYSEGGVDVGNWQVVDGNLSASDDGSGKEFELLGDTVKINGTSYSVLKVIYNGDDFSSAQQGGNNFTGAANPGDFAKFSVNGNQLDYNVTGQVFESLSGSMSLTDMTGNGVFFSGNLGGGETLKVARADNLGIFVVPTDDDGNETVIMGLEVSESNITEQDIWDKSYIYAEMGNNGSRYVSGHIVRLDQDNSMVIYHADGAQPSDGCWKPVGNHVVVKLGSGNNLCTDGYGDLNDNNADIRVVIRPQTTSGRSGFIADDVNGNFIGIGLEQRAINITDMNGTFDAYSYKFDGSGEVFVEVSVTNDGSDASYTTKPYICDQNGCTLSSDPNHITSGSIYINSLCDQTDLNGTMCIVEDDSNPSDGSMGFIDSDSGYFMITNDEEVVFGSKR
jgi:hypothetical protein